jgi:hypothetical protein
VRLSQSAKGHCLPLSGIPTHRVRQSAQAAALFLFDERDVLSRSAGVDRGFPKAETFLWRRMRRGKTFNAQMRERSIKPCHLQFTPQ